MSTSGEVRRPRNRIRTISSIFSQTARDVSGSAEQLSNLVTSVMIPATPPDSSMAYYGPDSREMFQRSHNTFRTAANGALATIIQLFFILSFAPVLLFAIFVVLTIALLTSGTITLALGAITVSATALALSLFTCVLPLSALSALVLFVARTIIQLTKSAFERLRSLLI